MDIVPTRYTADDMMYLAVLLHGGRGTSAAVNSSEQAGAESERGSSQARALRMSYWMMVMKPLISSNVHANCLRGLRQREVGRSGANFVLELRLGRVCT